MAYTQSGWSAFTKKTDPPKKKDQKQKPRRQSPTWEGTDEYRKPQDIPAQEYIDRGLNPADYIPGYGNKKPVPIPTKPTKSKKKSAMKKMTDPPGSAADQMKKLNKKYENQMNAKMDSIQNVYNKKSQFSADSLNTEVNKDIKLFNEGSISQNELKKRRPGVKFK